MKAMAADGPRVVRKNFRSDGVAALRLSTILNSIPTLVQIDLPQRVSRARQKDKRTFTRRADAGVRTLAEAIILQAVEDLWSTTYKKESIEFFRGEGFKKCADAAGMSIIDRLRLIRILRRLDGRAFRSKHAQRIERLSSDAAGR